MLTNHGDGWFPTIENSCRIDVDCLRVLVAGLGIIALYSGIEGRNDTLEVIVSLLLDRVRNDFRVDIDRHRFVCLCNGVDNEWDSVGLCGWNRLDGFLIRE